MLSRDERIWFFYFIGLISLLWYVHTQYAFRIGADYKIILTQALFGLFLLVPLLVLRIHHVQGNFLSIAKKFMYKFFLLCILVLVVQIFPVILQSHRMLDISILTVLEAYRNIYILESLTLIIILLPVLITFIRPANATVTYFFVVSLLALTLPYLVIILNNYSGNIVWTALLQKIIMGLIVLCLMYFLHSKRTNKAALYTPVEAYTYKPPTITFRNATVIAAYFIIAAWVFISDTIFFFETFYGLIISACFFIGILVVSFIEYKLRFVMKSVVSIMLAVFFVGIGIILLINARGGDGWGTVVVAFIYFFPAVAFSTGLIGYSLFNLIRGREVANYA